MTPFQAVPISELRARERNSAVQSIDIFHDKNLQVKLAEEIKIFC